MDRNGAGRGIAAGQSGLVAGWVGRANVSRCHRGRMAGAYRSDRPDGDWPARYLPPDAGSQTALAARHCARISGRARSAHFHLAQYKPYQFLPSLPATYPDDGRKLVDGVIPDKNFLDGKSVGWLWTDAAIHFDLGRVRNVSALEVHCQGGGGGAVNWPAFACAALSTTDMPPAVQTARGPLPPNTSLAVASAAADRSYTQAR